MTTTPLAGAALAAWASYGAVLVKALPPADPEVDAAIARKMPRPKPGRRIWSRAEHDPGDEDRS
jgi:hypothetical protein